MHLMQLLLRLAERLATTGSLAVCSCQPCLRLCTTLLQALHHCYLHQSPSDLQWSALWQHADAVDLTTFGAHSIINFILAVHIGSLS